VLCGFVDAGKIAAMPQMSSLIAAVAILGVTSVMAAQMPEVKLPASPRGTAQMQLFGKYEKNRYDGGKWITVDYGRPILRGRDPFGSGANYGKVANPDSDVWRAGANDTTRLTTQVELTFGTTTLKPGVYNVFVDLKENAWTLVLSNQGVQPKYDPKDTVLLYGAYNYDAKFDVARVPMRVSTLPMSLEQLTIGFSDVGSNGGTLFIAWGKTMGAVSFTAK
jgi:hypothetical protein